MRRATVLGSLCLGLLSCSFHEQSEGAYRLTVGDVIKDECNLAQNPDLVARLAVTKAGNTIFAEYSLYGMQLEGYFLASWVLATTEAFTMDGSAANVTTNVNGQDCVLERVTVHLDATTLDENRFDGTLSVKLDTRRPQSCVCELWAKVQATRAP